MLTIARELITPEVAKLYVSTTRKNRPLDFVKVQQYAFLMAIGDWNEDSRYIEFTEEGDLINGQHRLTAVIESGTPQWFLVVRGLAIACR